MFQDINSSFNDGNNKIRQHKAKDTKEFLKFDKVLEGWLKPQAHPEFVTSQISNTLQKAKLVWGSRYNFFKTKKIGLYESDFGVVVGASYNPKVTICMTQSGHEFIPVPEQYCLKDKSFNGVHIFGGLKDLKTKEQVEKIPKTVVKLEFIGYIQ